MMTKGNSTHPYCFQGKEIISKPNYYFYDYMSLVLSEKMCGFLYFNN